MALTFLHFSDIHFAQAGKDGAGHDCDLRRGINADVALLRERHGPCDGILVNGGVAFAATMRQYEKADEWIAEIGRIAGCPESDILVVPGEHDVNYEPNDVKTKNLRDTLRGVPLGELDEKLGEIFGDKYAVQDLRRLFTPYNSFARKYGCHYSGSIPSWQRNFELNGYMLTFHGLNSVLISEGNDKKDERGRLVLGDKQSVIDLGERCERKIHVVMCHHPPSWLRDGDKVRRNLRNRAHLQLFAHSCDFDVDPEGYSLHIETGPAHSPQGENLQPRYNMLRFGVEDSELRVEIWPRIWSKRLMRFIADTNSTRGKEREVWYVRLGLDGLPRREQDLPTDRNEAPPTSRLSVPEPHIPPLPPIVKVSHSARAQLADLVLAALNEPGVLASVEASDLDRPLRALACKFAACRTRTGACHTRRIGVTRPKRSPA